ncbi:MerR family transcriptional regulator [Microbacterium karelineae]|uniref:MerR family transcriptional regulator n=1 Tax=Microbacterium karelineae TaxID=2654283 RepID=UPI0012EAD434|nr:MerR family transcriptional regulator [Microbacterium karelineae]
MRISELARRSGVATATIKFYLREGLVPPGELTSSTQAQYGEAHVERLRLVRALLGQGGLTVAQAREVLRVIDDPGDDMFVALGAAQGATYGEADGADEAPARELITRAGWAIDPDSPEVGQLARALAALDDAGFVVPDGVMDTYLSASTAVGEVELAHIPEDPAAALRYAVLGTILVEPLLAALRRLAEQDASARRYGPSRS